MNYGTAKDYGAVVERDYREAEKAVMQSTTGTAIASAMGEKIEGIVVRVQRGPTPKTTHIVVRVTKGCDTRGVGSVNLIRSDRVFKHARKSE